MVLMSVTLRPGKQEDTAPAIRETGIAVTLVSSVAEPLARSQAQLEQPVSETVPASENSSVSAERVQPATTAELSAEVPATARVADEDSTAKAETVVTTTADRGATQALVNTAIADYRTVLQTDLNRAFVEGCIRQRNRYGPTSDCPESFAKDFSGHSQEKDLADELFAVVTRDADDARMRWQLERENEVLLDIMVSGGPAGEQAEIRWRLNRQYHAYLSDNIHPELTHLSQTAFVNNYNRTITAVPYQFECSVLKPCVYKFTGFTVKRPANYVKKTPSFAEQTPLFMPSQD